MRKNYVLDTNVLIHDPHSIFQFEDNNVYVPVYTLEELDKLKNEHSIRGRNSREVCKIIDELRCHGSLSQGIKINDGYGSFVIYVPKERRTLKVALDSKSMDAAILQAALEINDTKKERTILVTMDVNLRIRAESIGLQTASYESQSIDLSRLITGQVEITSEVGQIDRMFSDGYVNPETEHELFDNACVMLRENERTALGRYRKENNELRPIRLPKTGAMGIRPRNREQQFALDMLLDPSIQVMTLVGFAGTGKTLLAVAAGLQNTVVDGHYSRLIISRPVVPMGRDIGYLPGTLQEKMDPWMQPIYDNLELLMMTGGGKRKTGMKYEQLFEQDVIRVEPLTYMRGRSLPSQYIIIDEAQNLTPHEIKTIITRCGEGSKIVLTGDPDQIDNPYMDKGSCGLTVAVEKFHDHSIFGHITLTKGERSELANLAATVM